MLESHWKKRWLFAGIGLFVAGILMLAVCVWHNTRYDWYPVHIPLELKADSPTSAEFVAAVDGIYEIELQFEQRVSTEITERYLLPLDKSPMKLTWSITSEGETVAQGDSLDYLYLSFKSFKRRLWNALLRAPDDFGVSTGKILRGIGSFHAVKGERYTISTRVQEVSDELAPSRPAVAVRINRMFSDRHYAQKLATGGAGLFALAGAGLCGVLWLLLVWRDRRSKE